MNSFNIVWIALIIEPCIWATGSMNLLWAYWLVLSFYVCLKAATLSWKWVKKKNKTKKNQRVKQSSEIIKTGQRVPKHLDNCGHVEHRISIPLFHEFIRYCFLTILKHFNWCTVYSTKCSLFICKYLFIYLFGLWFLNAYLCIHIILYASEPYVKAVLLLKLS